MNIVWQWWRELFGRRKPTPFKLPPPRPSSPFDDRFGYGVEVPPSTLAVVLEPITPSPEVAMLERRRKKHDKFVEPKGELPPRLPKVPRPRKMKVKVEPPPAATTPADAPYLVGTHHEDRSEDVFYDVTEVYGTFNFRDTILQQLDRYFVYLKRMKRHDSDSYEFYKEVGATILPYIANGADDVEKTHIGNEAEQEEELKKPLPPLSEWFHRTRPTFGCFAYATNPEMERHEKEKKVHMPKFLYYTKMSKPAPRVQAVSGGDVYTLTVWWDKVNEIKAGVPQQFAIFVSADGKEISVLRIFRTKRLQVQSHKPKWNGRFSIPQPGWHMPEEFDEWAKEKTLLRGFLWSVKRQEAMQFAQVRVMATNAEGLTATFAINMDRISYFFQDRDIELTERGTRKRVFHAVRAHRRADGAPVKIHFRGERDFTWAGYKIHISVPLLDHPDPNSIDFGLVDEHWVDPAEQKDYAFMPEVGKMIGDRIKAGPR